MLISCNVLLYFALLNPIFSQSDTVLPIIELPDLRIDDLTAYQGYTTRFYRDSAGNTLQISLNKNTGRVVHLLANGANESISFTVRNPDGHPEQMRWHSDGAVIFKQNNRRFVEYTIYSPSSEIDIGLFLLGSMRKEREFQYHQIHLEQFGIEKEFIEPEFIELINNINRLPARYNEDILWELRATSIDDLEHRLLPTISIHSEQDKYLLRIEQYTFEMKNLLSLELIFNSDEVSLTQEDHFINVQSRSDEPVRFKIRISTDSSSLSPLRRDEIFNKQFLDFYKQVKARNEDDNSPTEEFLRLDRQIRSVELLSSREKLMAGLPNFATYFGRDMIMSALMMEPITTTKILEHVISAVLKKLNAEGRVSHEEALGGQAIRENTNKVNHLLKKIFDSNIHNKKEEADQNFKAALQIIKNLQSTVENYIMVDDDFQFPVLVARYLGRSEITSDEKIKFLLSPLHTTYKSETRLSLIIHNLVYITESSLKYVNEQSPLNLISFPKMPESWYFPASWRDSNAGYAGGRFAMDVNAIWVPHALESTKEILNFLNSNGFTPEQISALAPEFSNSHLETYYLEPEQLDHAVKIWREAKEHFRMSVEKDEILNKINRKLEWFPGKHASYWSNIIKTLDEPIQKVSFYALSLDENGHPLPVINTDPAMFIFLENYTVQIPTRNDLMDELQILLSMFYTPYPIGLFVEGLGTLAANDVIASQKIWERFRNDDYHSPTTVWGREINLLLLGLMKEIVTIERLSEVEKSDRLIKYHDFFTERLLTMLNAVETSGLKHTELWTYRIHDGVLHPLRYPTTSDIQLWSLTDLTLQFYLDMISMRQ